jgi:hypothetical protein
MGTHARLRPKLWTLVGGLSEAGGGLLFALGLIGPGQYSLDVLLGFALPTPATFLYGLVAVLVGVVAMLVTRAPAPDAVVSTAPNSRSTANAA